MKTQTLILAALAVLASPAAAEPENPGADAGMAAHGYVREPASSADTRVTGLSGPGAVWNGDPLWKMLIYCGAMHGARGDMLEVMEGDEAEIEAAQDRARRYNDLGVARFAADRGVARQEALRAVGAENSYWTFGFIAGRRVDYAAESRVCEQAEARNGVAG